ncbi:MAG: prepilin-type N-terminal cleavage/methylation domain-containing protein [Candidatus Omnitrophota bacterium]
MMGKAVKNRGFTLVEIIVIISIIALIAAVAINGLYKGKQVNARNVCIANLRLIDRVKSLWAIREEKGPEDEPEWSDLVPVYFKKTPVCPEGGKYTIGSIDKKPACTVKGHGLP